MAKNNERKNMPKKKSTADYVIYIVIAAALAVVGLFGGYVVQHTLKEDGSADYMTALNSFESYLTGDDFIAAVSETVKNKDGYARKGFLLGGVIGLIIFAYYSTKEDKRYHRKGEEHGSARWGTEKEKKIIQDTEDFYNNVIVASDVLLVLDRKKRELNAMTDKEKKAKAKKETAEKKAEEKRLADIRAEITKFKEGET